MGRVFLIVLDSFGIGEAPDAAAFGDTGANTLQSCWDTGSLEIPNLLSLGLGNMDGVDCLPKEPPKGQFCRMAEASRGKDTTVGHWELTGVVSKKPLPVYPDGFPEEILAPFRQYTGREVLANAPWSGTEVIESFGKEHMETGALIVYTSADSVFQIAAHEDVVPIETLYDYCRFARKITAVGRVIARPFVGRAPDFTRTANRRDFSLEPPRATLLDAVERAGQTVYAIGKISDIFAARGVTQCVRTHSNEEGMQEALRAQQQDFDGLCFVNLVDFDMMYGHRQDVGGYAAALTAFDRWLPTFLDGMRPQDMLMITADHGCDPGDEHTDHTREYVPLLVYGDAVRAVNLGTRTTFADIAATAAAYLGIDYRGDGEDMTHQLLR